MKTRQRVRRLALPLIAMAAGLWIFSNAGRHPASSSPEAAAGDISPTTASAAIASADSSTAPKGNETTNRVAGPGGAQHPAVDPSEVIARLVAKMDRAEVIRRIGALSPEELRGDEGRLLARRWAELDAPTAGRWVTELSDVALRRELSSAVALGWSQRDLAGALAWAHSLAVDDTQTLVLTALCYEVARRSPAESLQMASALPSSAAADEALLHALRQDAGRDLPSAQEWALQLPAGALRERALADVATVMASEDGGRAARFVFDHTVPGPEQERAVAGVIQRWARQDYNRVLAWVAALPPALRENAVETLVALPTNLGR